MVNVNCIILLQTTVNDLVISYICLGLYIMTCPFLSDIQREQEKVKRSIKDAAKKGQRDVCVVLAKEMIHSKRAISKLHASKAQMNSVVLSMKNQVGEFGSTATGSLARGNAVVLSKMYRHKSVIIIELLNQLCCHSTECIYVCFSTSTCSWVPAEEHRGDEGHAEPCENPRDPEHHEGAITGDDEGLQQHPI